ncbi:MAG TPA: hypothetical protein VEW67_11810 [Thermoleophilaceae bacterium]|nr:hypothetical protein [Thermoleophilaceae bacterium]
MSEATIRVPPEHVEAIRRSLNGRRGEARSAEIESLLGQIGDHTTDEGQPRVLVGSRTVLWGAVYDSLCVAAEQLADDFNEYWRGAIDPESARARIATVTARLELLVALGSPPAG